ncbi:MAG TPA: phosphatase PAP2 family protein, partial [Symbiobacteriaceae bacterium]|nr:phosphatase PAP2 family protein [Symbiobacteriaceae bacterium]
RFEWDPLTHSLTFVYIIVFPLLMLSSLVVYSARNDLESLKRLLTGYWLNYLVAVPFYIWMPVKEAWAGTAGVRFLIPVAYPAFEAEYRVYSALDNCFPSLHTSLAVTYALIAWRCGYRRLAIVLSVAAGLVMLSTLYLGVHWVPDLFAGVALATVASGWLPRLVSLPGTVAAQENR